AIVAGGAKAHIVGIERLAAPGESRAEIDRGETHIRHKSEKAAELYIGRRVGYSGCHNLLSPSGQVNVKLNPRPRTPRGQIPVGAESSSRGGETKDGGTGASLPTIGAQAEDCVCVTHLPCPPRNFLFCEALRCDVP